MFNYDFRSKSQDAGIASSPMRWDNQVDTAKTDTPLKTNTPSSNLQIQTPNAPFK